MRRLAWVVLALAVGCRAPQPEPATAPVSGEIRLVAILPFVDETGRSSFDGDEFGGILASEFVKASGVRAIRPAHLRAALGPGETISSVGDAIRVARKLGADTVLACAITDYDPYDPPRVGVHAQLLRTEPRALSTKDLDVLLQSASWRKGPLPMSRDAARHALAAFEEVYDARDSATRRLLAAYAQKSSIRESELLAIQPRYLQFVSSQIITRAWEIAHSHGS
jgi:hypothetical protein